MKKIAFILVIVLGIVTMQSYADGNSPKEPAISCTLSGKVSDISSGELLGGVAVEIEGTEYKAYTDFDGNFIFKDLKPGSYTIVASFISYKNSLIENIKINAGDEEEIEIGLQEK